MAVGADRTMEGLQMLLPVWEVFELADWVEDRGVEDVCVDDVWVEDT